MIREVLMGGFCGVAAGRTVSLVRLLCAAVCMVSAPSFAAGKTSGQAAAPSATKAAVKVSGKSQGGAVGSTATPSAAPSARKRDGASADRRASDQRPTDKRASVSASRAPTQTGGRAQLQPVNTSERRGKPDLRPQARDAVRDARGQRDARVEKAALSGKAAASGSRAGARTTDAGAVQSARRLARRSVCIKWATRLNCVHRWPWCWTSRPVRLSIKRMPMRSCRLRPSRRS